MRESTDPPDFETAAIELLSQVMRDMGRKGEKSDECEMSHEQFDGFWISAITLIPEYYIRITASVIHRPINVFW